MKYLVFSLLLVANLFALPQNQIQSYMSKNVNKVVQLLQNAKDHNTSKEIVSKEIFKIFDPVFNFSLMGRLALESRVWGTLNSSQKSKFISSFTKRLKASYKSKLDLYKGQKIRVYGINKVKRNRIHLLSEIKGKKQKYDIVYKFYEARDGQWYIYDVSIVGVSIIQTYRAQFSDELKKMSFDELLAKLNKKL